MESPAFQFYPAEFLSDENVVMMSNQEIGCYMKLMCFCWREGSIPSDITRIAKLCGEDSLAMAQLWLAIGSCFALAIDDLSRLVHPRLEKERNKQQEHKKERSKSGVKGAEARWGKISKANSSAIAKPMANDGSSSSSSSSIASIKTNMSDGYSTEFELAWATYPARPGANKKDSFKAWNARLKGGADPAAMVEGTARYANYCKTQGVDQQFIKQPVTFFGPGNHYSSNWAAATPQRKTPTPDNFAAKDYGTGVNPL